MDNALKQRLVGASVLIILAVIVLPMLLSGRSDTLKQESRQIALPPKPDELSFESRRFPVGGSPEAGIEGAGQPEAADRMTESPVTAAVEEASGDDADTAGPGSGGGEDGGRAAEAPPAVVTLPAARGEAGPDGMPRGEAGDAPGESGADSPRYLVQVASFSSGRNANALAERLRAQGLPVMMDVVKRTAGALHRVRVGPYVARQQADAVVVELQRQIKDLSPRVLDMRPSDSAPVSAPSDPLVRWVVQVGSFSAPDSADELVARLRGVGLPAFSEAVVSSQGTAYKVRVGPEIDRDKALEMARSLKTEHGLDGFVTTQD